MLFTADKTLMQLIVENEMKTFADTHQLVAESFESYTPQGMVLEIRDDSNSFNDLVNGLHSIADDDLYHDDSNHVFFHDELDSTVHGGYDGYDYLSSLTSSIIKYDELMPLREALQTIIDVSQLNPNFAGALLIKDREIINPFHPLMALHLIDNIDTSGNFRIAFYSYEDKDDLYTMTRSDKVDPKRIEDNLNAIISFYISRVTDRHIKIEDTTFQGGNIRQTYRIGRENIIDSDSEYFVVPNQILTEGIFAPWYGTTLVRQHDHSVHGTNLSPFLSANVSGYQSAPSEKIVYGSVCAGEEDSSTVKGMRTLNHSNLSSPMNDQCVSFGSIAYADACVAKCTDLYELAGIYTKPQKEETDVKEEQVHNDDLPEDTQDPTYP